jgi:hypothetical protein
VYTPQEYLAFEEPKRSQQMEVYESLLSPEGASMNDICRYIKTARTHHASYFILIGPSINVFTLPREDATREELVKSSILSGWT